jgi:hypothetical protein
MSTTLLSTDAFLTLLPLNPLNWERERRTQLTIQISNSLAWRSKRTLSFNLTHNFLFCHQPPILQSRRIESPNDLRPSCLELRDHLIQYLDLKSLYYFSGLQNSTHKFPTQSSTFTLT